jgi:hypothetical protein
MHGKIFSVTILHLAIRVNKNNPCDWMTTEEKVVFTHIADTETDHTFLLRKEEKWGVIIQYIYSTVQQACPSKAEESHKRHDAAVYPDSVPGLKRKLCAKFLANTNEKNEKCTKMFARKNKRKYDNDDFLKSIQTRKI